MYICKEIKLIRTEVEKGPCKVLGDFECIEEVNPEEVKSPKRKPWYIKTHMFLEVGSGKERKKLFGEKWIHYLLFYFILFQVVFVIVILYMLFFCTHYEYIDMIMIL